VTTGKWSVVSNQEREGKMIAASGFDITFELPHLHTIIIVGCILLILAAGVAFLVIKGIK
jgi:hypothetical protein